jgi:hypothetical protein
MSIRMSRPHLAAPSLRAGHGGEKREMPPECGGGLGYERPAIAQAAKS